jgi:RNA ligase (TIGR02306 family)
MGIAVRILPITSISDVPNADRLSVNRILGYDAVTNKDEDGNHRFSVGERVVYVPEGAMVPDELLQEHGFWALNPEKGVMQGTLCGPRGNVIKPMTLRKQLSTGLIWKVPASMAHLPDNTDVADAFGIVEWIPPVPAELLDMAMPLFPIKTVLDIARLKMYPGFLDGDEVVVTEKLEGECIQMLYMGGQVIEGLHGGGRIAIATKGMSRSGYVFKDVERARRVPIIRAVEKAGLIDKVFEAVKAMGAENERVRVFSEAIGAGVKKLHYAEKEPNARGLEIRVNERWFPEDERASVFDAISLPRAPVLYRGMFDLDAIEALREGPTTIGGQHMREGVVIASTGDQSVRQTALGDWVRPTMKYHSDKFLKKFGIED